MASPASFEIEEELWAAGHRWVVGTDEVGRGSWAGPLLIAACAVRVEHVPGAPAVADSKALRPARRPALADAVLDWAPVGLGEASVSEIDEVGMAAALRLASRRSLESLAALDVEVTAIIQDGSASWIPDEVAASTELRILPKADARCVSVAAASVVAKVRRDAVMAALGRDWPSWAAIGTSAGYGTAAHAEQLRTHGLTPLHRRSWSFAERLCGPDAVVVDQDPALGENPARGTA